MNIRTLLFACVSLSLAGCIGGGTSDDPTMECGVNSICFFPDAVRDIAGLWDRSGVIDTETEVLYTYISASGRYEVYDYQQDDFGTGENCYTFDTGSITSFSDSMYRVELEFVESDSISTSESSVTIVLGDGTLEVLWDSGLQETWRPLEGVSRDDLSLCE